MIYISDLDGTLLHNNVTLSSYARKTITSLLHRGFRFTIATARSVVSAKQILGSIPFQLPIVELNGASVTDYETQEHLLVNDIEPDIKEPLLNFLLEHNCPPFISGFNKQQDCVYYEQVINGAMAYYLQERTDAGDKRLTQVSDIRFGLQSQTVCFTVLQENPAPCDLQPLLHDAFGDQIASYRFDTPREPYYWLTIHAPKATKANGIRALLDQSNLSSEQLTVFGDNYNDLPMFDLADRAIAVSNARPEIRDAADIVIGSNDADSVVHFITDDINQQSNA